jgi:hypothetical protein
VFPACVFLKTVRPITLYGNTATQPWTPVCSRAIIPGTVTTPHGRQSEYRSERALGAYLFALCVYQIGIYCWPGGPPFILDPRAGIPVLLINHFSFDNKAIYPVEWITATWLVASAGMIFFRRKLLWAYVIAETVLAAPTAYYICVLADRHGGDFAPGFKDLVLTVILFVFFSLLPVALAVRCIYARRAAAA